MHTYTIICIHTCICMHIRKQIRAYTYTKFQYMYVHECIYMVFISSFLQGQTRNCLPSEEIRPLKCTGKKVFKMMQNSLRVFRSRTPVSKAKGDALYH